MGTDDQTTRDVPMTRLSFIDLFRRREESIVEATGKTTANHRGVAWWQRRLPFEDDSRRRWWIIPATVVLYVPAFFAFYRMAGVMAFGFVSLLAVTIVGALAGTSTGIVTGLLLQSLNFLLARYVPTDAEHPVLAAAVSVVVCSLLAVATGGLRRFIRHVVRINRQLDENVRARKSIEAALEQSLNLHRNLLATLGEGVALFDADNRFLIANSAAERLFGVSPSGLVGRSLEEFLAAESLESLRERPSLEALESTRYELKLASEDNRIVLVTETQMNDASTHEPRILRVIRDETARVRLERERSELQQYLRRTEALRSLAVMAGGVAHDFNNLLSGVIGSTELGLLRVKKSPESVKQCLDDARKYALEASELSRKMLAYAGKQSTTGEPLSLAVEVGAAIGLVSSLVAKKATLDNRIRPDLPELMADRTGLHQVVTNLVLNSIEAILEGARGTLVLDAAVERVDDTHPMPTCSATMPGPGKYVVLSVADTGVGMTEEVRSRLFEPFFSTKFQGRGMGLAATLGIVRAHGGGISVQSTLGQGSTFRVYWPVAREDRVSAVVPLLDQSYSLQGTTVLLVDDEPAVRHVTTPLLEELGCSVLQAENGRQAVDLFERNRSKIDLVLLDLTMPEQSGLEIYRALRGLDPRARVVLTSGFGLEYGGDSFPPPGISGFLPKPHGLSNLRAAMVHALSSSNAS